jgi:hypothetical protein
MHKSLVVAALVVFSLSATACQTIDYPLQNTDRPDD